MKEELQELATYGMRKEEFMSLHRKVSVEFGENAANFLWKITRKHKCWQLFDEYRGKSGLKEAWNTILDLGKV